MDNYVIETQHLVKKFSNNIVINNVNLHIKEGSIYGLLGRNGAGKTTIMKLLLGLLQKDMGSINLFGKRVDSYKQIPYQRIGNMIESPAFYPNLTSTENLEVFVKMKGVSQRDCIQKTLGLVGLPYADTKLYSQYSLGMKQRLALANALLLEPEVLILDEPINGLDPAGIVDIRNILLEINSSKKTTILLSSHILSEVAEIADTIGILHSGILLEERTMDSLNQEHKQYTRISVSSTSEAAFILEEKCHIRDYKKISESIIHIYDCTLPMGKVNKILNDDGILVEEIVSHNTSLEDHFLKLTGGVQIAQ